MVSTDIQGLGLSDKLLERLKLEVCDMAMGMMSGGAVPPAPIHEDILLTLCDPESENHILRQIHRARYSAPWSQMAGSVKEISRKVHAVNAIKFSGSELAPHLELVSLDHYYCIIIQPNLQNCWLWWSYPSSPLLLESGVAWSVFLRRRHAFLLMRFILTRVRSRFYSLLENGI